MSGRPATYGFQKPQVTQPRRAGKTSLGVITENENGLACSCGGFATSHPRAKVRGDKAERHLNKVHNGQGMWI